MYHNPDKAMEFIRNAYEPDMVNIMHELMKDKNYAEMAVMLRAAFTTFEWTPGTLAQREAAKTFLADVEKRAARIDGIRR